MVGVESSEGEGDPFMVAWGITREASPGAVVAQLINNKKSAGIPVRLRHVFSGMMDNHRARVLFEPQKAGFTAMLLEIPLIGTSADLLPSLKADCKDCQSLIEQVSGLRKVRVMPSQISDKYRENIMMKLRMVSKDHRLAEIRERGRLVSRAYLILEVLLNVSRSDFTIKGRKRDGAVKHHLWVQKEVAAKLGLPSLTGYVPITQIVDTLEAISANRATTQVLHGEKITEVRALMNVFLNIEEGDYTLKQRQNKGETEFHLWIRPIFADDISLPSQIGYKPIDEIIATLQAKAREGKFWEFPEDFEACEHEAS